MSVASFIFTYLKSKLPSINWDIGSTIRELIVTPVITLTDAANSALFTQANAVTLKAMQENPQEYKEQIEELFDSLDLQERNTVTSEGIVTIITNSKTPNAVLANTAFYIDDNMVKVISDVRPSMQLDPSEPGYLRQLSANSYAFEVPVQSISINSYLPIDTILTWDEAPEDIYEIIVTTPISGGITEISLEEKVSMIKDYISPNVLSLSDGITKMLRQELPELVVDAQYDITDIESPYATTVLDGNINKSYLYVKTTKAPQYIYKTLTGTLKDNYYQIEAHVLGLIDVKSVTQNGVKIPITQIQIENNKLYCSIDKNNAQGNQFEFQLYVMTDYDKVQEVIDGYTAGSPFYIEVKAPSTFNLVLDFTYSGTELTLQNYSQLCQMVQSMPLSQTLTDTRISAWLQDMGSTVIGPCTYTLYTHSGCCYKQQYATALYYPQNSNNYAIYLGVTNINAKHI